MDIYKQAHALGQAITETDEYRRFALAEQAQQENEEAMELVNAYNKKRTELGKRISISNPTKEEIEAIRSELNEEFAKLTANKTVNEYIEANKEFSALVNKVNSIIDSYVSGGESSCSGSCSTCGGCH